MKVGPIDARSGFPLWYVDENGLRLELNADPNDPFSGLSPGELPNPGQPVSFPDNFPGEAFYFLAEAEMETGTGERAGLVLALEAAFANEVPRVGEQIVFGRVRIRVAGLVPNEQYIVTHPYGVDTFIAEPDGDGFGEINFTEDIGGLNGGDFHLATNSRIQPFLMWDPSVAPAPPDGYLGDPNVLHPIIGSPFGEQQNIFRIEGPGIGIDSPDRSITPDINPDDCIETREFALFGKVATLAGVDVNRATYTQGDATSGYVDVFASSYITPQEIQVTGPGIDPTILSGENGEYFARVAFSGSTPPNSITVTNFSDGGHPASIKEIAPVDFIFATATYNTDTELFTIKASSSDTNITPELTVVDFGNGDIPVPSNGILKQTITNPPSNITISSSAGGSRTISVHIIGSPDSPVAVSANAGIDQTVLFDDSVTLDGRNSTGPINGFQWVQLSGEPVNLEDADTATPYFTAPDTATTLIFELTVEGEGEPSSDTVTIEVIAFASAPIANAGPNKTVQQGTNVTLSGTANGDVTNYRWQQIAGPTVVLNNAETATADFTFPAENTTLAFEFTVVGPGGSSSDVVVITTTPDQLTVTRSEFRTEDSEWRISGTSDVTTPGVTITIYIGDTLNGSVLAEVFVDPLGEWEYREESSSVEPDGKRAISIQSSSGGMLLNVPINIRQ